jgi:hypothetical protein
LAPGIDCLIDVQQLPCAGSQRRAKQAENPDAAKPNRFPAVNATEAFATDPWPAFRNRGGPVTVVEAEAGGCTVDRGAAVRCCSLRERLSAWNAAAGLLICVLLGAAAGSSALGQDQQAVCDRGEGHFEARLHNGAGVAVGPLSQSGFASRTCSASLTWKGQTVLQAATAGQIDIDVMGADLGFGVPVAAFVIRQSADDWESTYSIYSLDRSPRLLAKLTGGDLYRAVDADFDGRLAIWTTDAAAVRGFDGLHYADFDFAPTIVLRFEHRRLEDVSAEYPKQYDQQIAHVRSQLTPQALAAFEASDGRLEDGFRPWPELIALRKTKAKVLEIVWSYLYSGRAQEAWAELTRMWPAADVARAKPEIAAARTKGFDAQAASVAQASRDPHHWRVTIDDTTGTSRNIAETTPGSQTRSPDPMETSLFNTLVDAPAQPIAMMRNELAHGPETVLLTIDAAGKVQSVTMPGAVEDPELLEAAKAWKFIPAFKGGHAVASRLKMDVQPYR